MTLAARILARRARPLGASRRLCAGPTDDGAPRAAQDPETVHAGWSFLQRANPFVHSSVETALPRRASRNSPF